MHTLNLGILAHVDAGKTSLTERILFETGVISQPGRVDTGTTQTDSLDLERQRGITIQTAVASFRLADLSVNLIDTPGHTDFIAEVGRALQVLDAVILVVSGVEGVQSQTRRLANAVRAANLPLLIFINKIDRAGARSETLIADIGRGLDLHVLPMSTVSDIGSRAAEVIAADPANPARVEAVVNALGMHNDELITRYFQAKQTLSPDVLKPELAAQVRDRRLVPAFFGSAMTGAGVGHLLSELPHLFGCSVRPTEPESDLSATVFKVQRTPHGEKVGLARVFSGRLAVRDQVAIRHLEAPGDAEPGDARITALERYRPGGRERCSEAGAGDIVRVHGIPDLRIGDAFGEASMVGGSGRFPPPTFESEVRPVDPADAMRMFTALSELEEQDPLISIRRGDRDAAVSLRLYGEVQKQVIEATLLSGYGVAVVFESSQTLCIERVVGMGSAEEVVGEGSPFVATIGLEVKAGALGTGLTYYAEPGELPHAFYRAIEETVRLTLREGLGGWEILDCDVRVTRVGYVAPVSVAADFRNLTPLVLMDALKKAGTVVCEPFDQFTLEIPTNDVGAAYGAVASVEAIPGQIVPGGATSRITGVMTSANVHRFEQQLPSLAQGQAMFTSGHLEYRPVHGDPPQRARTDLNPLHRKEYLARLSQR